MKGIESKFVSPQSGDAFFQVGHGKPFQMLSQSTIRFLGVMLGSRAARGTHFLAQQLFSKFSKMTWFIARWCNRKRNRANGAIFKTTTRQVRKSFKRPALTSYFIARFPRHVIAFTLWYRPPNTHTRTQRDKFMKTVAETSHIDNLLIHSSSRSESMIQWDTRVRIGEP